MSVKWNRSRAKYEVRWLEGGKHPSRLFDRKGNADAFDLEKKRQRQLGALTPTVMRSRITLAEFMAEDWWPRYAIPNLADETRRRYLEVWGKHLLPRLGDYELRAITPCAGGQQAQAAARPSTSAVGAGDRGADTRAHADRLVAPAPWRRPVGGAAGVVAGS